MAHASRLGQLLYWEFENYGLVCKKIEIGLGGGGGSGGGGGWLHELSPEA